jgi:hypothetical protein
MFKSELAKIENERLIGFVWFRRVSVGRLCEQGDIF